MSMNGFVDRFETLQDVTKAIQAEGVNKCGLIFGIDYNASNAIQGKVTFHGKSIHQISDDDINPYQEVIRILGATLEPLDDDGNIPAFGFKDHVFPLKKTGECQGFHEVLKVYNEVTPGIKLEGDTDFSAIIDKAVEIVKTTKQYHILVIVTSGQIKNKDANVAAVVNASKYPLSIIVIGVGDGPWDVMNDLDDNVAERQFDNVQFVDFHTAKAGAQNPEAAVALAALMEIPDQYKTITSMALLEKL